MKSNLAIVIPAFKSLFIKKTLISLENQTNKNFIIYIGDDNSPEDIKSICDNFKDKLNIQYTRFTDNYGARNLVDQWNRCIALINNEEWIWLFSDDDVADAKCIETFYLTLKQTKEKYDVYRFNTRVIDDHDTLICETPESPYIDTSENMAYWILMSKRGNTMPDLIFSRNIYEKYGLVKTDYAQGADWATSILFSLENGICTIPNCKVNWRCGSFNISGNASKDVSKKIKGHFQFLSWIIDHFEYMKVSSQDGLITYDDMLNATELNLIHVIRSHYLKLPIKNIGNVFTYYKKIGYKTFGSIRRTIRLYFKLRIKRIKYIKRILT